MLEILPNCCSKTYLDMLHHAAMCSSSWNMLKPIGLADKHLQLPIIENEVLPNTESLSGMSLGLLIQILDSGGKEFFLPEVSYCAISMKDRHRTDNRHVDHANDPDYIKVLGLLNSDWVQTMVGYFCMEMKRFLWFPLLLCSLTPKCSTVLLKLLQIKRDWELTSPLRRNNG